MHLEPATPALFRLLTVQPHQQIHAQLLENDTHLAELCASGAVAVRTDDDARVIGIGGVLDRGGGVGEAWAWCSHGIAREFLRAHVIVRRYFAESTFRRIEIRVDPRHQAAVRWAALLGFDFEAPLRSWLPDGHEAWLFSRIRSWL